MTIKYDSLFRILLCVFVILFTQDDTIAQVVFKGKIENLPAGIKKVSTEYWSDDRWLDMGTIQLEEDNSFQKNVLGNHVQARLRIFGQTSKWMDFIMPQNPSNDSVIDFGVIDYNNMDGAPAKLSGRENENYFILLSAYKKYRVLRDSIAKTDSLPASVTRHPNADLEKAKAELNRLCKEIALSGKGTFTGDVVVKILYVPVKSDYFHDKGINNLSEENFEREHLIDRLPFGDKRALLYNGFLKSLNRYAEKFPKTDSVYLQMFVDKIMSKRSSSEEVNTWLFHYLLLKSVGIKDDISVTYLLSHYLSDCTDDNVDQSTKTLITSLQNCQPGTKAFNLSLPDSSNNVVSLAEVASKSKLTILFFWRSDCSHCKEFEPELEVLYKRYKSSGLEVIGISLDNNETTWKKYLQANPMSWVNLIPFSSYQRKGISENFPIPGTPSLIAVDKDFIVKNRLVIRSSLETYLIQELKK